VCDFGFSGEECDVTGGNGLNSNSQTTEEPNLFPLAAPEVPKGEKSVLFVVDAFGALNSGSHGAASYETLAQVLRGDKFSVSVLYVGEANPQMTAIAQLYLDNGITVHRFAFSSPFLKQFGPIDFLSCLLQLAFNWTGLWLQWRHSQVQRDPSVAEGERPLRHHSLPGFEGHSLLHLDRQEAGSGVPEEPDCGVCRCHACLIHQEGQQQQLGHGG